MKSQTLTLDYLPTDQNTYFNAERTNRFKAAEIKKTETASAMYACRQQRLKPMVGPVKIIFHWHLENKRKDPDNVCFAKKFILDGIVEAEVLKNDNLRFITGFEDHFIVTGQEKVVVTLII